VSPSAPVAAGCGKRYGKTTTAPGLRPDRAASTYNHSIHLIIKDKREAGKVILPAQPPPRGILQTGGVATTEVAHGFALASSRPVCQRPQSFWQTGKLARWSGRGWPARNPPASFATPWRHVCNVPKERHVADVPPRGVPWLRHVANVPPRGAVALDMDLAPVGFTPWRW
jgi:hypothetical protein